MALRNGNGKHASTARRGDAGLPANQDAERFVLGSILLDEALFVQAAGTLEPDDFSLEKHRRIFKRMGDIQQRGEKIDRVTVANELMKFNELETCDGLSYLVSLDDGLPQIPNLDGYVRILKDKATRRRIIFSAQHMINRAFSGSEPLEDIVCGMQTLLSGIGLQTHQYRSFEEIPSLASFANADIRYLVEPVLPAGAVVGLTGDSGSGKSSLLCALGRKAGVPVLVLDRENPRSIVDDRRKRLDLVDGPLFRVLGGWLPHEVPMPDSPMVMELVRSCDPKPLVIVDSLVAFMQADENDAAEMRRFMQRCRRLADLGATAAVIHHDGKSDTSRDFRGSSDYKAAVDVAFHVTNTGQNGRLDKLVLRCFKSRFGFGGSLVYSYAGGRFDRGDVHDVKQTLSEQCTTILRINPGCTTVRFDELARDRGIPRHQARTFLMDGLLAGTIRKETGSRNVKRYFLVDTEERNAAL